MFFSGFGDTREGQDNAEYYKTLGVLPSASAEEIKSAYKGLAREHHPDKGGDPDRFKRIVKAYEVLSDEAKRHNYDSFGEASGNGDIFSQLFRASSGGGLRKPKGASTTVCIKVDLEQVCNGTVKKLSVKRRVIDREKGIQKCERCQGLGTMSTTIQTGHTTHRIQRPCPVCAGQKNITSMTTQDEILNVYIDKGLPDGHKIVFTEKGDEIPGATPGDVVVVVENKTHNLYRRDKANLVHRRRISLCEALTGVRFDLIHPDKRKLNIQMPEGTVAEPSIQCRWDEIADSDIQGHDAATIQHVNAANIEKIHALCVENEWECFVWDQKAGTGIAKKIKRDEYKKHIVSAPNRVVFVRPEPLKIKIIRGPGYQFIRIALSVGTS